MSKRTAAAALLTVTLALAACGDDEVTAGAPAGATPDVREFSAMITRSYGLLDFSGPLDLTTMSPTSMASNADLVVTGRIVDVHEGRLWDLGCTMPDPADRAETPHCTTPTVMMTVAVDETHKGTLPEGSDGLIYVEYQSVQWTAAAFNAVAPIDHRVVLYLQPGEPEATNGVARFIDGAAGRPEGQPVWQNLLLGFVIEDGPDRAVGVYEYIEYEGVTLAEFVPSTVAPWPIPSDPAAAIDPSAVYGPAGLQPRTPPDRVQPEIEPEPEG